MQEIILEFTQAQTQNEDYDVILSDSQSQNSEFIDRSGIDIALIMYCQVQIVDWIAQVRKEQISKVMMLFPTANVVARELDNVHWTQELKTIKQ